MIGEFRHALDEKGRFLIPAKLRDGLGPLFYAAKGFGGCIFLYPQEEYLKKMKSLKALGIKHRKTYDDFMHKSGEVVPDKQFRALVPQKLREHAKFNETVVLVGMGNYVEVWDADVYDNIEDVSEEDYYEAELAIEEMEKAQLEERSREQ